MKTEVVGENATTFELSIVIEADETEQEIRRAAILTAQKRKIAPDPKRQPAEVVRSSLGKEEAAFAFDEEVMRHRVSFALTELGRDMLGVPKFACSFHVAEGEPFAFRATCVKVPQIELSSYESVSVSLPEVQVSQDEISAQIEALANASAQSVADEKRMQVNKGDDVEIALSTTREGKPVRSLTARRRLYHTGSLSMPDAFDEAICSMSVGQEKTFSFEGPSLERDSEGNPLMETFVTTVKLLAVLKSEKPALDDAWAARVMPGCASMADLRAQIAKRLRAQKDSEHARQVEQLAVSELTRRFTGSLSDEVYDAVIDEAKCSFADQLAATGTDAKQFAEKQGIDEQQLSMSLVMQARSQLISQLSLDAYARHWGLELVDEDLDVFFETISPGKARFARADFENDGRMYAARCAALRLKARRHLARQAQVKAL